MSLLSTLGAVGKSFRLPGEAVSYSAVSNGIINATYKVNYKNEKGNKSYIFQKINTYVFKNPEEIMSNIDLVTEHIRGKNPDKVNLHFHHTLDGKNYVDDEDGFWRVMNNVESVTYNTCDDENTIRRVGEAFGDFQMSLSDFDGTKLYETIPNFHNTTKRIETLFSNIEKGIPERVSEMAGEIEYIRSIKDKATALSDKYNSGLFPVRVTHNDTKCNNVLFDKYTGEPLVVIDLDTVMPGMAMYDFADAVRFICNTAREDEPDLSKVSLDKDKFKAFSMGFLRKIKEGWTEEEINSLVLASFAITIELAVRFLDDYITGDKYFKTQYEGHNAVRTRCQITLAKSIMEQYDELTGIIQDVLKEL
ncbi:MAG: aminoglycoside phosphotransferase family protein [Clostridia bacterium]|nr:aminoglycoside phosphotransferase family protein [Clostridia bacterium]